MRQRSLKRAALGTSLWVAVGAWSVWLSGGVSAAETQEPDPPRKKPDCVFVPTPHDIVEHMLDMAHVQKGDVVYDLGCGDGRIVIQAARKRGCRGVGFEIDPELAARARAEAKRQGVEHLVEIRESDLFQADMSEATVLPIYLLPWMLQELKPKLAALKAGTRIVSHDYRIPGAKADKVQTLTSRETGAKHILLFYTLPFQEPESR